MFVYDTWVYLDSPVPPAATMQQWAVTTCIATNFYNEYHLNGVKMGYLASRIYQPYGLGLGTGGLYNERSTADIGEIIIFRRRLTPQEIANTELYLAIKWNIAISATQTYAAISGGTATASLDYFKAAALERTFLAATAVHMTWGVRVVPTPITLNTVLMMSVYVNVVPYHWGIPLWVIIADSSAPFAPTSACYTLNQNCGLFKFYRICFNCGNQLGTCDEVSQVPVGAWITQSRHLSSRFAAKYGVTASMPLRIKIFMAQYGADSVAEVFVDDIRVVQFEGRDCPLLSASSLGQQSNAGAVSLVPSQWVFGSVSGGLMSSLSSASIRVNGTVQVGVPDVTTSIVTNNDYAGRRVSTFEVRWNAGTPNNTDSNANLRFCNTESQLRQTSGVLQYLHISDGYFLPPSSFTSVKVSGSTSWSNDKYYNLGVDYVPYNDFQSYTFFVQLTSFNDQWGNLFFRGGNVAYTNAAGAYVSGGADRSPAVFLYPGTMQIHIRTSTNTNSNEGCDAGAPLTILRWTHVSMVYTPDNMNVYYDGNLVCTRDWAGAGMVMQKTPGRLFQIGYGASASGFANINDMRYYSTDLNGVQVMRILTLSSGVSPLSAIMIGSGVWVTVTCVLEAGTVSTYENGALKMTRNLYRPSAGASSGESFTFSQSAGNGIDIEVRNVYISERVEAPGTPVYCPATGNFYQFVTQAGVSFTQSVLGSATASYLNRFGHLATLASASEYACVTALVACQSVWIDGSNAAQANKWVFTQAPNVGQSLYVTWGAGEPKSGNNYVTIHKGGCIGGTLRTQSAASGAAYAADGYIVEYETPDAFGTEYGIMSAGATISSTTPLASNLTWLTNASSGEATMRSNLIVDVGVPATAYTTDGRTGLQFSGASSGLQQVVLDMGAVRQVNRIGASVFSSSSGTASRVWDCIVVETSTVSASLGFTGFSGMGTCSDGVTDVANDDAYFFMGTSTAARWIRYSFGLPDGSFGSIVTRLRAQFVRGTISRLFVDTKEVFGDLDGLKMAAIDPTTFAVTRSATYRMNATNALTPVAYFANSSGAGSYILAAQRDPVVIERTMLIENFDSYVGWQTVKLDLAVNDFYVPRFTYKKAQAFCYKYGWTMCPKRIVCRPPGYGWRYGQLNYGRVADALAYMPVSDSPNLWIANGNAFTVGEICATYEDLNGGATVSDALAVTFTATRLSCCNIVLKGRNWNFYNLGVFNNTGSNHAPPWATPPGDQWYPPVRIGSIARALRGAALVVW